ncbi:MAG: carboxypeptidase regulatory-like domain-containing protein [Bacteroidales bacterium]|nr:carboxypeptidase regulatory-like domain-containing protein [Bacteroidales bacterium]
MKYTILLIPFLLVLSVQVSFAQNDSKKVKITGIVTDANSRPVEGALILADGAATGAVTNSSGEFRIKVLPGVRSLTAVYELNSDSKTIDIGGNTKVTIRLDKAAPETGAGKAGENEAIDIGYGTSSKNKSTGSATKTSTTKASSKSYMNIYDMIKSEVPGVQVIGRSIIVQQGTTSLTAPSEPLFVVDGTIVTQIDGLIPSQVRSISLLKGSAASIYGSRGTNGVLVFTLIK